MYQPFVPINISQLLQNLHCSETITRVTTLSTYQYLFCFVLQYSVQHKKEQAHDDSIWCCAWVKSDKDGVDNIVTGGVDDLVKCWQW